MRVGLQRLVCQSLGRTRRPNSPTRYHASNADHDSGSRRAIPQRAGRGRIWEHRDMKHETSRCFKCYQDGWDSAEAKYHAEIERLQALVSQGIASEHAARVEIER